MNQRKLKLNLGCGSQKLKGYINIDSEKSCRPDLLLDILRESLPYKDKSVDEVVLFHTIEHIAKRNHKIILNQVHRVLKPSGQFLLSYPEFSECIKRWQTNHKGERDFWEKTIFGRQSYPSDTHLCAMDTHDFKLVLEENGFTAIKSYPEPSPNEFSTIIVCKRSVQYVNYESLVLEDMSRMKVIQRSA